MQRSTRHREPRHSRLTLLAACTVALTLAATAGYAAIGDLLLVTRATGAGAKSNGDSFNPVISDDGRYVAYHSAAANIDTADPDATDDVYVRDTQTATTILVSR